MTVLPMQRIQCDRCATVFVPAAKRSDHWGSELFDAGWVARPGHGGSAYRHACRMCAAVFLDEIDGRRRRRA